MTQTKILSKHIGRCFFKSTASMALAFAGVSGCLIAAQTSTFAQVTAPPFGPSFNDTYNKNIFYFTPWGAQLDNESSFPDPHVPDTSRPQFLNFNIYDIAAEPNTPLDFKLYLYGSAPQYINEKLLSSFEFSVKIDPTEYTFPRGNLATFAPNTAIIQNCPDVPNNNIDSILRCEFKGPELLKVAMSKDFLNEIFLGTFQGVTVNPGPTPHDGISDFKLSLNYLRYSDNTDVANVNGQYQDVELQRVPAPLPILAAVAAFSSIRKARKFSSRLKTFTMD